MSIDLAPFVAAADIRSWMNNPLPFNGDLVACNGHLLVVLDGAGAFGVAAPSANLPKLIEDARSVPNGALLVDIADVTWQEHACFDCGGTGTSRPEEKCGLWTEP